MNAHSRVRNRLTQGDFVWDVWSKTYGQTAVALAETGDVSALKGLMLKFERDEGYARLMRWNPADSFVSLRFLPLVDGAFHAALKDTNDYRVMDRGVCLVLQGLGPEDTTGRCGPKNLWNY